MADAATKLPIKNEDASAKPTGTIWSPLEALRNEIDQLFEDFAPSRWRSSERALFGRTLPSFKKWTSAPAVDVIEKEDAYEVTAEVPGLDAENIEVRLSDGVLSIRGEKHEDREESRQEYHLSERRYGSFQRSFRLPDTIDADRVEAYFGKGVLTVKLPKSAEAKKSERKIAIKAA